MPVVKAHHGATFELTVWPARRVQRQTVWSVCRKWPLSKKIFLMFKKNNKFYTAYPKDHQKDGENTLKAEKLLIRSHFEERQSHLHEQLAKTLSQTMSRLCFEAHFRMTSFDQHKGALQHFRPVTGMFAIEVWLRSESFLSPNKFVFLVAFWRKPLWETFNFTALYEHPFDDRFFLISETQFLPLNSRRQITDNDRGMKFSHPSFHVWLICVPVYIYINMSYCLRKHVKGLLRLKGLEYLTKGLNISDVTSHSGISKTGEVLSVSKGNYDGKAPSTADQFSPARQPHIPVMANEVLEILNPRNGQVGAICTGACVLVQMIISDQYCLILSYLHLFRNFSECRVRSIFSYVEDHCVI